MAKFQNWLINELNKRDWPPATLAKKAGINPGNLSRVINGVRQPGPDMCNAIAEALNEPPEKVFRLAGLLPPLPSSEESQSLVELVEVAKRLSPEKRKEAASYLSWLLHHQSSS